MVKCMNERQQFMKVRKAPRQYPSGALLAEDEPLAGMQLKEDPTVLAKNEPSAGAQITEEPTPMSVGLPASFDIRERWPECTSVFNRIRNQLCNNCWAYSSTSAMSDRICIASNATTKVLLSADDLTTCCTDCQSVSHQCSQGGYPSKAFKYWISNGIVSELCKPSHEFTANATQECTQQCTNPLKDYSETKYYGQFYLTLNNATRIQQEILANGSLEVLFVLHPDLYNYESGIYIPTTSKASNSYHSVRLIGWGELNTTAKPLPYWIGVNSWGREWGENGTFRVIRGINAGNIEQFAVAGFPRVT
ncbi:cathepsin B1 isotype 4 precursor [Aphelenchoides avenae]|nr:cathepsin B1 isotype 4 precursor [Aphelenchus avenae]